MIKFFNSRSRVDVAFENYVEDAVREHPLPWSIHGEGKVIFSSDGQIICLTEDMAQAEAVLHFAEALSSVAKEEENLEEVTVQFRRPSALKVAV